ncbi:MAG: hypothetical protein OXQ29_00390 [Rhodospirillaceae bacterium]|nr:hypothetical protein [Rhodospirillaceae bacterium]
MAKGKASTMDRVSALIAAIEAEAYARGKADTKRELLEVLGGGASRGRRRAKSPPKRRTGGRKRAPRGSVARFVERVLRAHPGSTVADIAGHAADDTERSIKVASLRVELRNGRIQGRYVSDDGRWWRAGTQASAPAPVDAPSPGSATGASPGTDRTAGAPPADSGDAAESETDEDEGKGTLGLNL